MYLSSSETAPGSEPGAGSEGVRTRRGKCGVSERVRKTDGLGFSVVRCAHLSCVPWISKLVERAQVTSLLGGCAEGDRRVSDPRRVGRRSEGKPVKSSETSSPEVQRVSSDERQEV